MLVRPSYRGVTVNTPYEMQSIHEYLAPCMMQNNRWCNSSMNTYLREWCTDRLHYELLIDYVNSIDPIYLGSVAAPRPRFKHVSKLRQLCSFGFWVVDWLSPRWSICVPVASNRRYRQLHDRERMTSNWCGGTYIGFTRSRLIRAGQLAP